MKQKNQATYLAGWVFIALLLVAVIYISQGYIVPLLWAGILVIATWPVYEKMMLRLCRRRSNLAALLLTVIIAALILVPMTWFILLLLGELLSAVHTLDQYNATGIAMPAWVHTLPFGAQVVTTFWSDVIAKPKFLQSLAVLLQNHMGTFSSYAKVFGVQTMHHGMQLFICFMAMFFFYRDGHHLQLKIQRGGQRVLDKLWQHYFAQLPAAIRGVVNGTVLVGVGVGILMGASYAITGVPLAVLFGALTAVFAMVPFGMIISLCVVVVILLIKHSIIAALCVLIWGLLVSTIADNVIKPTLIGTSTQLPFLMILIGILGGVEMLGIIGLFLGPIIMVLFYTLFQDVSKEAGK